MSKWFKKWLLATCFCGSSAVLLNDYLHSKPLITQIYLGLTLGIVFWFMSELIINISSAYESEEG